VREKLESILRIQVNDSEDWEVVGLHALQNPELLDCLFEMSQQHEELGDLAMIVANNPHCSESLMSRLALIDNPWEDTSVRIAVACNPMSPESVLQTIWDTLPEFEGVDLASDIVWCLARNPRTPNQVLEAIATSQFLVESSLPVGWQSVDQSPIAYALAANPGSSDAILERISQYKGESEQVAYAPLWRATAQQQLESRRYGKPFIPEGSVPPEGGNAGRWRFTWTADD